MKQYVRSKEQVPFPWIDQKYFWGSRTQPINDNFHACDEENNCINFKDNKS